MKKVGLIIGLFLVLLLSACVQQQPQQYQGNAPSEEGRAVFTVTDAAANMSAVTSIKLTVEKVSVYSSTEGWIVVSSTPETFDLLQLKAQGSELLLADAKLKNGNYEQVRLDVSKVVVTDASGDHIAKLPSGELKIAGDLVVNGNSTSTAKFDFLADESLHITGNGEYILAPVIKLDTEEDADVEVKADNKVEVRRHGIKKTSIKVGMDENGEIGVGLEIGRDKELSIEDGKIKVGLALGLGREETRESANASMHEKSGTGISNNSSIESNGSVKTNVHVSTSY